MPLFLILDLIGALIRLFFDFMNSFHNICGNQKKRMPIEHRQLFTAALTISIF